MYLILSFVLLPNLAQALTCKVLSFGETVRCPCATTLIRCDDGREGYISNGQLPDKLLQLGEGSDGMTFPPANSLKVLKSNQAGETGVVLPTTQIKCDYFTADGKGVANPVGSAVENLFVKADAPKNCTETTAGAKRVWPSFCAAYVSCGMEAPKLIACPTYDGNANGGCVNAQACMAAYKSGKTLDVKSVTLTGPSTDSGITASGVAIVVKKTNADGTQQPVCMTGFTSADGAGFASGPSESDGSCKLSSLVADSCMSSDNQRKSAIIANPNINYTSLAGSGISSPSDSTAPKKSGVTQ